MNIASAEMLQNSLQNLGNTFQKSRQQDIESEYHRQQLALEKQRLTTDQALREAQLQYAVNRGKSEDARADAANRRADAQDKRLDLANQPHVQAELKSDDGQTMTFTGTPDQLENLMAAAKQQGKTITVSNKKAFAAQFNVGGAQFSFQDQDAATKFADEMKTHGVDVYAASDKSTAKPDEVENTTDVPEVPDSPAVPPVSHWFKPDEPGKPAVPGHPAGKVTTKQFYPHGTAPVSAAGLNSQVQGAMNPAAAVPPVAPLTPAMGGTALNTNGVPTGKPDPRDVQWLGSNPTPQRVAKYESVYGKGSASALLTPPSQ